MTPENFFHRPGGAGAPTAAPGYAYALCTGLTGIM